jgi:hypothetical protein
MRRNIHYFKRKLDNRQKLILCTIPSGSAVIYLFFTLLIVDPSAGLFHTTVTPMTDEINPVELLIGLAYVIATTLLFAYAIVGTQVFYFGKLSSSWALLLIGISLNTFADYYYYYAENFGEFLRSNPVQGIWVVSTMVVCYALYKHVKESRLLFAIALVVVAAL